MRVFKSGADGGVDVSGVNFALGRIAQCKRYIKSDFNSLIAALGKEKDKIDIIKPSYYYVFTSLELKKDEVSNVYDLFKDYMHSEENIFDGTRISEFLQEESNKDIVYKNYKLWLVASSVLNLVNNRNIIIDGEVLVNEINKNQQLYVQTDFYHKAVNSIFQEKVLLITGAPGVGKTTTSNMTALYLIANDCSVIYSSGNNISDIKKSISMDSSKKELVYLDDFLGQAYLDLKYDKISEIASLIAYVKNSKNKFLIMNSRITILNEAERQFIKFKNSLEDINIKVLDLDKMSDLDKAKILKNHLYHNGVDDERLTSIKCDKNYFKIINHKNYNPRIIEFATESLYYDRYEAEDYFNFIIRKLDNPDEVWADEFDNRLKKEDRLFMYTLYSLGLGLVGIDVISEAFAIRIKNEADIDKTKDVFGYTLKRLSDSLVKIVSRTENSRGALYNHATPCKNTFNKNVLQVGVSNPSINDYLRKFLEGNRHEIEAMLSNAVYVDQYTNLLSNFINTKEFAKLLSEERIFFLKYLWVSPGMYYLKYIKEKNGFDKNSKEMIIKSISTPLCDGIVLSFIKETIVDLFTKNFVIKNEILKEIIVEERLDNLLDCLELTGVEKLTKALYSAMKQEKCSANKIKKFKQYVEGRLDFIIEDLIAFSTDDGLSKTISEAVSEAASTSCEDRDDYIEYAVESARGIIERDAQQLLADILPIKISGDWIYNGEEIDVDSIMQVDDLLGKVSKYIHDEEAADYYADQWREYRGESIDEKKLIDEMFNK